MGGGIQDNNTRQDLPWNTMGQPDVLSRDPAKNLVIPGTGGTFNVINTASVFIAPHSAESTQRGSDVSVQAGVMMGEINNPLLVPPGILPEGSKTITFAELIDSLMKSVSEGDITSEKAMSEINEVMSLYAAVAKPSQPVGNTAKAGGVDEAAQIGDSDIVPLNDDELTQVSNLRSVTPAKVLATLLDLTKVSSEGDVPSAEYLSLAMLAANIALGNLEHSTDDLDFSSPEKFLNSLAPFTKGITPPISPDLLTRVSIGAWALNDRWLSNLNSADSVVVNKALTSAVDQSNLNPAEKKTVTDYLTVLSKTLAFMSEIRATIITLDGEFSSKEGQAKLDEMTNLINTAVKQFTDELSSIDKQVKKMAKAEAQRKLMSWLGPLITVVTAIISIVSILATFGAATPAAVGLMAGVIAATTTSLVMTQPKVAASLAHSLGWKETDPRYQALVCGIQMAITIVCTLGAGAAAAAAQGMTIGAAAAATTRGAVVMAAGTVLQSAFTSGILTSGFYHLSIVGKKKPLSEKDEQDAQMIAMVMTIVMGIAMAGMMIKTGASGSLAKTAADNVDDVANTGAKVGTNLAEVLDDAAGSADDLANAGSKTTNVGTSVAGLEGAAAGAADASTSLTTQIVKNIGRVFERLSEDPARALFVMQLSSQLLQIGTSIQSGATSLELANLTKQQAQLNDAVTQGESMLKFMKKMLSTFDPSIDGLREDSKKMNEQVTSLSRVFAQFISTASSDLSGL